MSYIEANEDERFIGITTPAALERFLVEQQHGGLWKAVAGLSGVTIKDGAIEVKTVKRGPFIVAASSLTDKETRIEAAYIDGEYISRYTTSTLGGRFIKLDRVFHILPDNERENPSTHVINVEAKFFEINNDPRFRFSYRERTETVSRNSHKRQSLGHIDYEGGSDIPFDNEQMDVVGRGVGHINKFTTRVVQSLAVNR